jgi:hypothetical protein
MAPAGEAALFEMVRVGDARMVGRMMNILPSISPEFHTELLKLAISSGSTHTIKALFEGRIDHPGNGLFLLEHAIQAKNMDVLKWRCINEAQNLPRHVSPGNGYHAQLGKPPESFIQSWKKVNIAVLTSGSSDIFGLWTETLVARTPALAFQTMASIDTSRYPEQEARLLALWSRLAVSNSVKASVLSGALVEGAQGCCSLAKGKALLELGADVHFRKQKGSPTALQFALRKTTREAAQFVKLLLLQGADPDTACENSGYARDEPGAEGISKWLGMDFVALVQWAKAERNSHNVP